MTEVRFQYDAGELTGLQFANRGSDDFRLQVIDDLELETLDADYVSVFLSWQQLRGEWTEAKARLDAALLKQAQREAEVRKNTQPGDYKASSAAERKVRFDAIVAADLEVQDLQKSVLTFRWDKEGYERDTENAEKEMAYIKVRLNWRTFVVRFLGTVQPVSVQEMAL